MTEWKKDSKYIFNTKLSLAINNFDSKRKAQIRPCKDGIYYPGSEFPESQKDVIRRSKKWAKKLQKIALVRPYFG